MKPKDNTIAKENTSKARSYRLCDPNKNKDGCSQGERKHWTCIERYNKAIATILSLNGRWKLKLISVQVQVFLSF